MLGGYRHAPPCQPDEHDDEHPIVGCCYGEVLDGPSSCTCWVPTFDLWQADPIIRGRPETRASCCVDCAYRNGSPEREGDEEDWLLELAGEAAKLFVCHQGIRRVVAFRHPDGREAPAGYGDYRPPIVDGLAYRADGTLADICAGFAAHRSALLLR